MAAVELLVVSTLYPNREMPVFAPFVEQRLQRLAATGRVRPTVIAPVPWFPFRHRRFGRYASWARVPLRERRGGLAVAHPRYPMIPKAGTALQPLALYAALRRRPELRRRRFGAIAAEYAYPDGVAAALLAREFGLPLLVTGRGTDLRLLPQHRWPRRWMRWMVRRAARLLAVCEALARVWTDLGAPRTRVEVVPNGVDLARFRPTDQAGRRDGPPLLLTVGELIPRKGVDLLLRALACLPQARLWIVGDGPQRPALERLTAELGLTGRVRFLGALAWESLPEVYNRADIFLLASRREGLPNVLLEALACGTPVVATAVDGIPEVVTDPAVGRLVGERRPEAFAAAIADLMESPPDPWQVRRAVAGRDWTSCVRRLAEVIEEVADGRP